MTGSEYFGLVANAASLILSIVAIGLSLIFFRWSQEMAQSSRDAATEMRTAMGRLDTLFDRFYADAFGLVRDTYSAMHRHMWPETMADVETTIEDRVSTRVEEIKADIDNAMTPILDRMGQTDETLVSLRSELDTLLNKVITETRLAETEAREETIRDAVGKILMRFVRRGRTEMVLDRIVREAAHLPGTLVLDEVVRLTTIGAISLPGIEGDPRWQLAPSTLVVINTSRLLGAR